MLRYIYCHMNIDKSIAEKKIVGVSFIKNRNRWLAQGKLSGKSKFLGYYETKSEAIDARNEFNRQFLEPKMRERDVFERHIIDLYMSGKSQEEAEMQQPGGGCCAATILARACCH